MTVGKALNRVDAYDKVTGVAKYTEDLCPTNALVAKVLHSTIANGRVRKIDIDDAVAIPGVINIFTCFDVPDITFPTAGHPWSTDPGHRDICDRHLLNQRVRIYGDDIAAVVAVDEIAASHALRAIRVEYDEYTPIIDPCAALAVGAGDIHEHFPGNLLKSQKFSRGNLEEAIQEEGLLHVTGHYSTVQVDHCHLEPVVSWAYMEAGRIVVVSSTQIPHIARRVVGQALGIPWGQVRIIKPYIGGGFGNKQEVLYEPLNAWLTKQLGGRTIKLALSREEVFYATRSRHAISFDLESWVRADGRLVARKFSAISNQGGYASHGHSILGNTMNGFRALYQEEKALEQLGKTVYTNCGTAGAMRAYGIPQAVFAAESHMDDIAQKMGIDPIELRELNMIREGYVDDGTGIVCHTNGLAQCIEKGRQYMDWEAKRKEYTHQHGDIRRGIGMAIFCYKTGVYPLSLETASARLVLNQDGTAQLQMGATEIGQGADTVFTQMAAQTIGFRDQDVHIVSFQDTDVTPFDTGAYASRQTYVSGKAVKLTSEMFKQRILDYAAELLDLPADIMDISGRSVIDKQSGDVLLGMEELAMEAFYSFEHSVHITAESTSHCKENTFSLGCGFAEIEVDIPLGKIKVLKVINVHDSGKLINPALAEAQVHGGMSMSLGYGLSERLIYDDKGRLLNGNFLDYKLSTAMDTPDLQADFVEIYDPTGPYGNKSLGEPPAIPLAPALRNALLNATGVAVDELPLEPQKLVKLFTEAGLIVSGGEKHV